jgi:hypothetical protein
MFNKLAPQIIHVHCSTMYQELPVFSVGATIGSRFFYTIAHFIQSFRVIIQRVYDIASYFSKFSLSTCSHIAYIHCG